jgi:hypothetical protein
MIRAVSKYGVLPHCGRNGKPLADRKANLSAVQSEPTELQRLTYTRSVCDGRKGISSDGHREQGEQ